MHLMEVVVVVVAVVVVVEGATNQRQPENRLADIQQKNDKIFNIQKHLHSTVDRI